MSGGSQIPGRNPVGAIPKRFTPDLFARAQSAVGASYSGTHCILSFAGQIDGDRVARAVRLAMDAEPILGCRWVEHWFRPSWQRRDDLDRTEVCEIRKSSNSWADVEKFVAFPADLPLRVLLLRGDNDVLCIKLDHRAGDGGSVKDCVYLLADIYDRLRDDPGYVPVPSVGGSSGMQQLHDRFSFREQLRIARLGLSARRQNKTAGTWKFPRPQQTDPLEFAYLRLDATRVRAIFQYALHQRTTMSQVLLAAFFLTVCHARPQSSDRPLPIAAAVDLRRHLPSKQAAGLGNLVGVVFAYIERQSATSLDAVVKQVRDQMQAQRREYFGLPRSTFLIQSLPILRHMVGLMPYGVLRHLRRPWRDPRGPEHEMPGAVMLTDIGELEPDRLTFTGTDITDAVLTGGVFKELPRFGGFAQNGFLGLTVSGFRGSLTLGLGYGPKPFVGGLLEDMRRILPA